MIDTKKIPETLTKAEFLTYLSAIIDLLQKLQNKDRETFGSLEETIKAEIENIRYVVENEKKGEKGDPGQPGKDAPLPTKQELLTLIKPLIPDPIPGKDGKDGETPVIDLEKLASQASEIAITEVLAVVPTLDEIEQDIPKLGKPIRDALELLPEGEKLEIEAIQNLRKELDELKRRIELSGTKSVYSGGASGGGRIVKSYDLSSVLDGSTKVFSLPAMWRIITVHLSSIPNILRDTVDYTYDANANTITFTSEIEASTSLANGQNCVIIYSE